MSNLILNSITKLTQDTVSDFIVADVINDAGFKEPQLITSVDQLDFIYRRTKRYKDYKYLLEHNIQVLLVCAAEEEYFEQYPTLSITDHPEIQFCYPKYSYIGDYYDKLNISDLDSYLGWSPISTKVYRYEIKLDSSKVLSGDYLSIPYIDRYEYLSNKEKYILLKIDRDDYPYSIDDFSKRWKIITNEGYLTIESLKSQLDEYLKSDISVELTTEIIDGKLYVSNKNLTSNLTLRVNNKGSSVIPDYRFTQDIYYLKSRDYEIIQLESSLLDYAGRLIGIEFSYTGNNATLSINYYNDNILTINGLLESEDDPEKLLTSRLHTELVKIIRTRKSKLNTPKEVKTNLNNFYNFNLSSNPSDYIRALTQFEEYGDRFVVLLASCKDFSCSNLEFDIYTKAAQICTYHNLDSEKSKLGTNNLLALFDTENETVESLSILTERLSDYTEGILMQNVFSGKVDDIDSVIYYITYWYQNKQLKDIIAKKVIESNLNIGCYLYRTSYDIEFTQDIEFLTNILLSYINFKLADSVSIGEFENTIVNDISYTLDQISSNIDNIDSLKVVSYNRVQNTLNIIVELRYFKIYKEFNLNFKIL
jgi:hypothetical protein